MTATIIDGKAFAANVRAQVAGHVSRLRDDHGITPGLAVVLVGEDPASEVYVRNKAKQTVEVGMASFEHKLDASTSEAELLALISQLNADPQVHGILVQLPLPEHLDSDLVINAIDPAKDVDGFHISNVGLLGTGQKSMVPCTPLGCLMMLRDHLGSLSGLNAVVVGRSNIVGKPMAQLLLGDSCTVTIAHSRTKDIEAVCRGADIVVAAVGRPEMIKGDWVKPGATVIDVGINRIDAPELGTREDGTVKTRLVGDVDFDGAAAVAGAITPVPGGVGPMTIACLLANTVTACCRANDLPEPEGLTA
ncbi:MAG: bifunctional methylenetetrahydrofolate dehydrogenase/methenyltetrahydrofolate cyclohydrolase FolD [Pseudomonadota bacterium]|nr:bifunctional methylenetetrahydrofolate dehydrogenase/methenyltetrahydrofolate cyclohydrolase FolD [Pseudomonadota bacterium]